MDFDKARLNHIDSIEGLRGAKHGKALQLAEKGYSSSGISNQLGVGVSTAKSYLTDLQDEFGENVIETEPKSQDWPRTHPSSDESFGSY